MAAKRKGNSEFETRQPVEFKPGSLKPDNVDALVSSFLAELTDISSEMQQRGIPALAPLELAGHSTTDAKNNTQTPTPAPNHKQTAIPVISQTLTQPSDAPTPKAKEYEWERLDGLRNDVVSPGGVRRRRKVLYFVPVAMLAVILGFLFYPRTDKKLPGPKADTQIPADLIVGTRAATGGTALRIDRGDPSALSPEKRIDTSRSSGTTMNEEVAAKPRLNIEQSNAGRLISKPKLFPVSQSERLTEPGSEISASLEPRIQNGANPQNEARTVTLPPPSPSPEQASAGIDLGSQARSNQETPKVAPGRPAGMTPADGAPRDLATGGVQREPAGNAEGKNVAIKPESASAPRLPPVAAQVLVKVVPDYPALARSQKVGGVVELEASINEQGDVVRAAPVAGPTLLRAAAEQALLKWKFKPASINGVAVASRTRVSMVFEMK